MAFKLVREHCAQLAYLIEIGKELSQRAQYIIQVQSTHNLHIEIT